MEIDLGKLPFDIDFHPSNPLVTAGLITDTNTPPIHHHRGIVTGSPDCSILATDVEIGSAIARLENSHGAAVNRIINLTESTSASGDDEGCIEVWDTRQRTCSNSFNAHEEYISDMTFAFDSMRLLGTSLVGILPNRIIQPIAEHSEYPVERLAFSHDKKFLGSISHDHTLKIWDMDNLLLSSGSTIKSHSAVADSDSDEMDMDCLPKSSKGTKRKIASRGQGLRLVVNY